MRRGLVVFAALLIAVIALACGGGGSSVTYAPTVVPITHIDFTGVVLTPQDAINPPTKYLDLYPDVVATVNGEAISDRALVMRELSIEFGKHGFDNLGPELSATYVAKAEATDALEGVINDALEGQAVDRMHLLPSYEDAVKQTEKQEQETLHPTGEVSPEDHAKLLATLKGLGYPDSNWASDRKIVEGYRRGMGQGKLLHQVCPKYHTPAPTTSPLILTTAGTCDEFLAKERKNAKIVYYVRWAD